MNGISTKDKDVLIHLQKCESFSNLFRFVLQFPYCFILHGHHLIVVDGDAGRGDDSIRSAHFGRLLLLLGELMETTTKTAVEVVAQTMIALRR